MTDFWRLLPCAILFLLSSCATAPLAPPREEAIDLRYGWEEGSVASVQVLRTTIDISPRGHYEDRARMRFLLRASRKDGGQGDETLATTSEETPRSLAADEAMGSTAAAAEAGLRLELSNLVVDSLPTRWIPRTFEMVALEIGQADFDVDGAGLFMGVVDTTSTQARVASWVAQSLSKDAPSQGMHGRLVELFSEEAISQRTAAFWNDIVGMWSGGKMDVGRRYAARDEIRVEGLGGIPVEMEVEVGMVGWVPCSSEEREPSCVHLRFLALPAPEQRPLLVQFTSALFPSDPNREVRIEHGMELVTEPDGLRPRWMRAHQAVEIPLLGGDSIVIADERDMVFRWEP